METSVKETNPGVTAQDNMFSSGEFSLKKKCVYELFTQNEITDLLLSHKISDHSFQSVLPLEIMLSCISFLKSGNPLFYT